MLWIKVATSFIVPDIRERKISISVPPPRPPHPPNRESRRGLLRPLYIGQPTRKSSSLLFISPTVSVSRLISIPSVLSLCYHSRYSYVNSPRMKRQRKTTKIKTFSSDHLHDSHFIERKSEDGESDLIKTLTLVLFIRNLGLLEH